MHSRDTRFDHVIKSCLYSEIRHMSHDRGKAEFCCVALHNCLFTLFSCQVLLFTIWVSLVLCCSHGTARKHREAHRNIACYAEHSLQSARVMTLLFLR
jgi:hypothetical protein